MIKINRFQIATEQYIELIGGNPTDKNLVAHFASRIKSKWKAIYQPRHDLGYTNDQIAKEVFDSLEE